MKKIYSIMLLSILLTSNIQAEGCRDCSLEADSIGLLGGVGAGAYIGYGLCVTASIAAGVLSAGAGFIAGMEICSAAALEGAVLGGSVGGGTGVAIDDLRDCCD